MPLERLVLKMQTMTLNNAARDFTILAPQVAMNDEIINVATDSGNLILISEDSYNGLLLSLQVELNVELKESLLRGLQAPLSDFVPEGEVVW